MNKYNFDEIYPRKGTASVKYDLLKANFGSDDLLPMWVADMDFKAPECVLSAIRERCDQGFLGYTFGDDGYFDAIISWLEKHYHIEASKSELHYIPGIVVGIAHCIQAFTQPGDKILITTPVYPPFIHLPVGNGRELVTCKLNTINGRFEIDFDELEKSLEACKMFLLSSPHNPGGRIWTENELLRIAEICSRKNVLVISDEIHADLAFPGYKHISFSKVSEEAKNNSITFIAPSKTFNIAGLSSSVAYIPNAEIRTKYFHFLDVSEYANGNIFAYIGAEAAFRGGEEWLAELKSYLAKNIAFADKFFKEKLPQVKIMLPEASYLLWLDFRNLGYSHNELKDRLINKAKVALNDGESFGGSSFQGFFRMNIGCPRKMLEEGLRQIAAAF